MSRSKNPKNWKRPKGLPGSAEFMEANATFRDADTKAKVKGYVVLSTQWGPVFMSMSLEAAAARLAELVSTQAAQTTLSNPASYRVAEVEAG
jgi:hypothetical protein